MENSLRLSEVRDWRYRYLIKKWESTTGLKQAKGLISGPSARRTKDLLKLNRDQLRWIIHRALSSERTPFQIETDG
jgi:hypothetical protein